MVVVQPTELAGVLRIKWPLIAVGGFSAQGLMLLIMCLCSGKGLKIFKRSEEEQAWIFGELLEHDKRITRECGISNSESMGNEETRKGGAGEAGNGRLFLAPLLMKLVTLAQ